MISMDLREQIRNDLEECADSYRRAMLGGYAVAGALYSGTILSLALGRPGISLITAGVGAYFHNEAGGDRGMYHARMNEIEKSLPTADSPQTL